MKIKKSLAWLLILSGLLIAKPIFAGFDQNINNFFNQTGLAGANVTNPSVYQGQEMGYLNAGSMVIKTKSDNLQLASLELPSLAAGCGSIDLFMGGFSFVNSQQLVNFGQEVMMDAIPVSIDLALKTVSPMLAGIKDKLQTWADKINQLNINSCEAAQNLVSGKWAKDLAAQAKACKDQGIKDGTFKDWSDAIYGCATGGQAEEETNKASNTPELKPHVIRNKNVVWSDVLEHSSFLSSDKEMEQVYMSISGTIVFDKDSKVTTYVTKMTDPNLSQAILYGGDAPIYRCDDTSKCLKPKDGGKVKVNEQHSLVTQVTNMIDDLAKTYKSDQPLNVNQQSFIALVDAPILKMIQDEISAGMTTTSVNMYSEVIAQRLLAIYLEKIISEIQSAMTSATMDDASRAVIQNSILQAEAVVRNLSVKSYQQFSTAQQMLDRTLKIAQIGAANLSDKAKQNMTFGE